MRTTDIIRNVLDLIDQIEQNDHGIEMEVSGEESDSRFKQIVAMLSNKQSSYTTEPNEVVADIEAVTTLAGGGVNGPKHPADIRVKDPGYGHGS
jgi:chemotaxis regulatin CheY-phosphate phosphatase CheZ